MRQRRACSPRAQRERSKANFQQQKVLEETVGQFRGINIATLLFCCSAPLCASFHHSEGYLTAGMGSIFGAGNAGGIAEFPAREETPLETSPIEFLALDSSPEMQRPFLLQEISRGLSDSELVLPSLSLPSTSPSPSSLATSRLQRLNPSCSYGACLYLLSSPPAQAGRLVLVSNSIASPRFPANYTLSTSSSSFLTIQR